MAIISGDSLNIDIVKLKQDLEQSGVLKVLSINPTATGFDCEIINAENFSTTLTAEELQLAESVISGHQDQQKRKLQVKTSATEVYDATNKLFVDNKINDIIGPNANAALDTLMELSNALNNDSNFATTIATQINQIESDITSLENDVQSLQQTDQLLASNIQQGDQTVLTTLSSQLSTEQTTRSSADNNLQNQITSLSSSLKPVATSGSYTDLTDKPTLFGGSYNDLSDLPTLFSGAYADLTGKPTLFSGDYADLSNKPTIPSALDDLSDVTISSPSNDQVLKYNGTAWVNSAAPAAGATDLDGLTDVAVTGAAKGQFIVHNGTSFVNSNTIEASGAAVKPLIVKGAASQSANLFEVQNSGGYDIFAINSSGYPVIKNLNAYSYQLNTNGAGALAGRGVVTCVTYTGGTDGEYFMMSTGLGTSSPDLKLMNINLGTQQIGFNTAVASISGQMHLTVASASRKGFVLQAAASQTGNLLEIQNSAGTPIFYTNSNGRLFIKNATAGDYLQLGFSTDNNQYGMVCGVNPGSGYQSTYIGAYAGQRMSGSYNTAVGTQALWGQSGASGTSNIGIGGHCGYSLTSGSANTLVGYQSGYSISTGGSTVAIGSGAGYNTSTGTNNVFVGTNAGAVAGAATNSHQIAIGSGATTSGDYALAIGRSASAAANCMDIRFGNASQITGDASGNIAIANTLHSKRYTETVANAFNTSLAPSTGTLTVDTSLGNCVLGALNAAVTTWAFTNVPTENSKVTTVSAVIAGNTSFTYGSACSVNGSAVATGVQWFGGTAPTPSSTTDVLTFVIIRDSAGTIRVLGSAQTVDSVIGSASAGIDGAGSANYLSKWTDANTISNSAIYETGGNAGIGTASPRNGGAGYTGLTVNGSTSGFVDINTNGTRVLTAYGSGNHCIFTNPTSTGTMYFRTQDTDRMSISSSGSVVVPGAFTSNQPLRTYNPTSGKSYAMGPFYNNDDWQVTYSGDSFATHTFLFSIGTNGYIKTGLAASSPYNATTAAAANMFVYTDGGLYRSTSSLKYKTDVQPLSHGLSKVLELRPVTYKGKGQTDSENRYGGLIAEEVHDAGLTEFVQYAEDGTPDALAYGNMVSLAFKAIQELNAKVDALQAEKEALEARIAALENN